MRVKSAVLTALVLLMAVQITAQETYFGKNKVRYKNFEWEYIQTRHFDIYFYEDVYPTAKFAADVLEAAYIEISGELNYKLQRRIPVFIYNSHNDFQQTNITSGLLPEGVAGFTEVFKTRIVLPFDGSYESFRETLHHELTHAVIYDLLYGNMFSSLLSRQRLFALPLWFAEGYAAYSSRHGWDYWSDTFVRDATINDYLIPPAYLSGYLAYRQGQAMVKYIADEWGEEKLGEIIKKGKILLTMNKTIKATLGITEKEFFEQFEKEMKRRYWPEIALRDEVHEIGTQLTHAREDGSFFNEAPAFSPDGDRLAIFSDISDYTEIVMISAIDGKHIKRLVKAHRTGDLESLHAYVTGISFSPDGRNLVFAAKSKGKEALFLYSIRRNKVYLKKRFDYYNIVHPAWSPDGTKIAFSALDRHKRDIFVYDIKADKVEQITDDRYDDVSPTWMPNSLELVFSSDRPHPGNPERVIDDHPYSSPEVILPGGFEYGFYNLFRIETVGYNISPLEVGPGQNKRPKVSPDGDKVAFISNRNGTDNIYISYLNGSHTYAVTDILTAVRNIDWSPNGTKIAFSAMNKGAFDIFILKDLTPLGEDGVLAKTGFALGKHLQPVRAELIEAIKADSIEQAEQEMALLEETVDSTETDSAETDTLETDTLAIAELLLSDSAEFTDTIILADASSPTDSTVASETVDTTDYPEVISETGTYGDEFVFVGSEVEPGPFDSLLEQVPPDSLVGGFYVLEEPAYFDSIPPRLPSGEYQVYKYKTKFTPDYMGGGFNYDTFFGVRGQTYFIFSDYLGNHQIYIATDLVNTIDQSIIQMSYFNNKNRIGFGGGFFHTKNYYLDARNYLFSDRFYGLSGYITRPFSIFSRLEFNTSHVFIDRKYLDVGDPRMNENTRITSVSLSYVNDNILWGYTGPINGRRAKITLEAARDFFDNEDLDYYAGSFDYRYYSHFKKAYSFAFRLTGGGSGGRSPKQYFLGGTTNWIGRRDYDQSIYEIDNLYFSDIITPLRGIDYYELQGNRYALMNAEFRFPLIQYFITRFPLALAITNVTGSMFLDMGSAWTDNNFKGGTSQDSGSKLVDIKTGFGFGMRANMFGFVLLRYDLAWSTDWNSVSASPTYYFSLGADF